MKTAALLLALLVGACALVTPAHAEAPPDLAGRFEVPYCSWGMAVDAAGCIYVAGNRDGVVLKYSNMGELLLTMGPLSGPCHIAIGPSGDIFVSESAGCRISEFTPQGGLVRSFGGPQGTGPGQFMNPVGLAVDHAGNVYVADTYNDRIEVFDPSGAFLRLWAIPGTHPYAVAMDANDRLYVSTSAGPFVGILEFTIDGTLTGQVATSSRTTALVLDSQLSLFTVSRAGVSKFDAAANALWLMPFGPWPGHTLGCKADEISGIALAPNGALYVLSDPNLFIYRAATTPAYPTTWGMLKAAYR